MKTIEAHSEGESIEGITFVEGLGGLGRALALVVSGATDGNARVWDVNTGKMRCFIAHDVSSSLLFFILTEKVD